MLLQKCLFPEFNRTQSTYGRIEFAWVQLSSISEGSIDYAGISEILETFMIRTVFCSLFFGIGFNMETVWHLNFWSQDVDRRLVSEIIQF